MNTTWPFDPTQPVLQLADPRLQRLMLFDPQRCATVTEYSHATGIDVAMIVELLGTYLDDGTLTLESVGGEVFVHTAPQGRPQPRGRHQVAPNLWEMLRGHGDTERAYQLWRLLRELEAAGWSVEADPRRIPATSAGEVAMAGLRLGPYVAPVLVLPELGELAHPAGVLTRYERRSVRMVAVICAQTKLDETTTAVRRWLLERPQSTRITVAVLETPRFQPVLLGGGDAAVAPRAVSRDGLSQMIEDMDRHGGVETGTAGDEDGPRIDIHEPPR